MSPVSQHMKNIDDISCNILTLLFQYRDFNIDSADGNRRLSEHFSHREPFCKDLHQLLIEYLRLIREIQQNQAQRSLKVGHKHSGSPGGADVAENARKASGVQDTLKKLISHKNSRT